MMHYVLDLEICALIFLAVIAVSFFTTRHFPSPANKLYAAVIICAVVDIALDIISSILIEQTAVTPYWLLSLVNITFYSLQTIFPLLLMTYLLLITGKFKREGVAYKLLAIPAAAFTALLIMNPLTEMFFYVSEELVYTRGPIFTCLYWGSSFYLIAAIIIANLYRRELRRAQYLTVMALLAVIIASMVVQYILPEYLLTGVAIALAIMMMYFTLQDPADMVDVTTGAFLYGAAATFLRDRLEIRRSFAVIALDVHGISRINDLFGIAAGTEAAAAVGEFLRYKNKDIWVFRISDARFLIATDVGESYEGMLWRITSRFKQPWHVGSMVVMLSASVRHFAAADSFKTSDDILGAVNAALSDAADDGTTTCVEINGGVLAGIRRRLLLESALRRALETGDGLDVWFQPIYSLENKTFAGAEALLRFYDGELGSVPPSEVVSIAERTGLVLQVDQFVLGRVCRFMKEHDIKNEFGLDSIEINLSPADFYYANLAEKLAFTAEESGIDPSMLIFEITETVTASDDLAEHMEELRARGFRFALDDFGTGYSNVAHVVGLPLALVKLDRSLLIVNDAEDFARNVVFEDLIRMFRRIGVQTVVEGVETAHQAHLAGRLGADFVQGYYYARPMPEKELIKVLSSAREAGKA